MCSKKYQTKNVLFRATKYIYIYIYEIKIHYIHMITKLRMGKKIILKENKSGRFYT